MEGVLCVSLNGSEYWLTAQQHLRNASPVSNPFASARISFKPSKLFGETQNLLFRKARFSLLRFAVELSLTKTSCTEITSARLTGRYRSRDD
jgi:hypothetical protein